MVLRPAGKASRSSGNPPVLPKHPHEHGVPPSLLLPCQPPLKRLFRAIAPAQSNCVREHQCRSPKAFPLVPTEVHSTGHLSGESLRFLGPWLHTAPGDAARHQILGVGRPARTPDFTEGQETPRARKSRMILCDLGEVLYSFRASISLAVKWT